LQRVPLDIACLRIRHIFVVGLMCFL
jgi:hypothetical protein